MKNISMFLLFALVALIASNVNAQFAFERSSKQQMVMTNLSSMPLAFTENQGQWGEKTLFKAEAGGAIFYFCKSEVAYLFVRDTDELEDIPVGARHAVPENLNDKFDRPRYKKEAMLIKAQFVDANPNPEVIGEDRLSHNCNYFYGNDQSKWCTDVLNYFAITYKDIWPGIDLKYHGNSGGMKYDFIVNPGANISQIRIRYVGVDDLAISNAGDLEAQTRFGPVYENIPEIYQERNGTKVSVSGSYRLIEQGVFGFEVDGYNPSLALVIDPELLYSTYLGGYDTDRGYDIAVDGSGSAYVTGKTSSSDFPTVNPYDGSYNSSGDVFVTKFSNPGNSLIYCTYFGGGDAESGMSIAIDGSGSAYVTGYTYSTDFPTAIAYDGSLDGDYDAFVTKLSPAGNSLIYSTYLGGSSRDRAEGIAVDDTGSAYITGYSSSIDFPTNNPYDESLNGSDDIFVAKFSPAGISLVYSTYLGGSGSESAKSIAVDGSGSAYVTGNTYSTDFPTANPYDESFNGLQDVFVTKLSAIGDSLIYSTYLGGDDFDQGNDITVDNFGHAYVTGKTSSSDFPMANPYDESYNGSGDVFVTQVSHAGNSLTFSTYLGGSGADYGYGIAIDGSGGTYITGETYSTDFPMVNPYDGSFNGWQDVFITKLDIPTGIKEDEYALPEKTSLLGNYPNPFNASTNISYSLSVVSDVVLEIYDLLGRKIETTYFMDHLPGNHTAVWNASAYSSGIYFYRITAGNYTETKKMVLLK